MRGRFVTAAGNLGTEFSINASEYNSENPVTAAFDGTNYLVVWMDETVNNGWDIFGLKVA